jgi:uncharacterized protein YbjT (DUF2867 family)
MILVVGSTGLLGGMIARSLLKQGKDVRVLVREGSDFQALMAAGAQPAVGDMKDRASLDAACAGVQTVITTANAAARGGTDTFESVDLNGNRSLIDAAKAAGVQQFIFVSALGAQPGAPNPLLDAKGRTEAYLKESGIPSYTILAPDIFMDVWFGMVIGMPLQSGHPVTLVGAASSKHSFVAVQDVAAFAVAAVDNPAAHNQYLPIGGPEAVSWTDVVEAVRNVTSSDISVNHIQPGEMIPGLPPEVSLLMAATETYDSPIDMTELASTFNVRSTPLQVFVRGMFGAP